MAGRSPGRSGGLNGAQVQQIRAALAGDGRPPRVALRESSSGLPAGTVGTVVRLADPAETDEFVFVRVNGDELPFTPAELELPPARPRRPKQAVAAAKAPAPVATAVPATADGASGSGTPAAPPEPAPQPPQQPAPQPPQQPAQQPQAAPGTRPGRPPARTRPPRREAARKPAKPVRLLVQLHYDERGWTVEASRGAKALVKPTPVTPAAALRVAELLDNDLVRQAIEDIADVEREEAERRAAELRAQLAEVEAVLAGYEQTR